jgi:hypothetical protein
MLLAVCFRAKIDAWQVEVTDRAAKWNLSHVWFWTEDRDGASQNIPDSCLQLCRYLCRRRVWTIATASRMEGDCSAKVCTCN